MDDPTGRLMEQEGVLLSLVQAAAVSYSHSSIFHATKIPKQFVSRQFVSFFPIPFSKVDVGIKSQILSEGTGTKMGWESELHH